MSVRVKLFVILIAIAGIGGYAYWQSTPQARAAAFLSELSEALLYETEANVIVLKQKSIKVASLMDERVEADLPSLGLTRKATRNEVELGYLSIVTGGEYVDVRFAGVDIIDATAEQIELRAFMNTGFVMGSKSANFDGTVVIVLKETSDGLRFSSIREDSGE